MENRAFKIAGIKNILTRDYKISSDVVDLKSLVDDSLSMKENWNEIKPKIKILIEPSLKYYYKSLFL